jgi:predicted acyltransferase
MTSTTISNNRIKSIDSFRGVIVCLMVIVNFIRGIEWIPALLKHAPSGKVTFVDLIAPAFIFIIGLTYPLSFSRRKMKFGQRAAIDHFIKRGLSLIGIEVVFYLYVQLFFDYTEPVVWNTLSIIGFLTLVSIPFINLRSWIKLLIGLGLIIFHQFIPLAKYGAKISEVGGGAYSLAGWASLIFMSLFMSDLFFKDKEKPQKKVYLISGIIFTIIGIISGKQILYIRDGISLSLCFLSIGVISLFFYIFHLLSSKIENFFNIFIPWGKNPLSIFILSLLFLPFNIIYQDSYIFTEPNWFLALYFVGYMAFLLGMIYIFEKKNIILKA